MTPIGPSTGVYAYDVGWYREPVVRVTPKRKKVFLLTAFVTVVAAFAFPWALDHRATKRLGHDIAAPSSSTAPPLTLDKTLSGDPDRPAPPYRRGAPLFWLVAFGVPLALGTLMGWLYFAQRRDDERAEAGRRTPLALDLEERDAQIQQLKRKIHSLKASVEDADPHGATAGDVTKLPEMEPATLLEQLESRNKTILALELLIKENREHWMQNEISEQEFRDRIAALEKDLAIASGIIGELEHDVEFWRDQSGVEPEEESPRAATR